VLVDTAARPEVERLADWQAALRRVATLVAQDARPAQTFGAVAEEVALLFDLPWVGVMRYEPDDHFSVVATWGDHPFPAGSRWPLDGPSTFEIVRRTGRAARLDDYTGLAGTVAEAARNAGIVGGIGAPIVVEGATWGIIAAPITRDRSIPAGAEAQLSEFTDLVATAIANAESRWTLARLADEQAALRRVATLVARGVEPGPLFDAIAGEVEALFGVDISAVVRFEGDGTVTVMGAHGGPHSPGARVHLDPDYVVAAVYRSRQAARFDLEESEGERPVVVRDWGVRSALATPIVVEGQLWGAITIASFDSALVPGTDRRLADFSALFATAIANTQARELVTALAEEQAALRRLAELVARESSPVEIFHAVTEEAARVLDTEAVGLLRIEPDGTATLVAQSDTPWDPPPLGTRLTLEGENVITQVVRTGRAVRVDDWANATGSVAAMASVLGVRSSVGTPVVVEGRLWGVMIAATSHSEPLPDDTESRIGQFTGLVATAIANAEAREGLQRLADEQAALRRVAVLVAQEPSPGEVFTAVTEAVAPLLGADLTAMHAFSDDGIATVVAGWSGNGPMLPLGTRLPLDGESAAARIFQTGAAARIDTYADVDGETAGVARGLGLRSTVGAPIVVEGRLWGALMAATRGEDPLPEDAEARIAEFTELVATAVSNADSRGALGMLAAEQAALRRVATLVAEESPLADVIAGVAEEVGNVLGEVEWALARKDGDGKASVLAVSDGNPTSAGARVPIDTSSAFGRAIIEGRPARIDDYFAGTGDFARAAREHGVRAAVSCPIVVRGRTWGAMSVGWRNPDPLPPETEALVGRFSDLVATAIARVEARDEVERLAEEQAALRRVATLVAEGVPPSEVFAAVSREVEHALSHLIDNTATVVRFDPGPECVLVGASRPIPETPLGKRWVPNDLYVSTRVLRTGASARVDETDLAVGGFAAEQMRRQGYLSQVASPILVEGRLWGAMTVSAGETLPPETGARLETFTELVATAIANAESQSELAASRRRIVAAADDARRRIERDLHDGIQQQLVSIGMELGAVEASLPPEDAVREKIAAASDGLGSAIDDLREVSRGIHPAILAHGGLGAALKALARRSPVPVQLTSSIDDRLPERVEVAAYYVASEALTNVARHANASVVSIAVAGADGVLELSIRDDGTGGADTARGTGLIGLQDRVEALGGRISVESSPGHGTSLAVTLPLGEAPLDTEA
jgi:GAF domain-containing protein